ncbi:MAG: glycoside hydrolase family 95 protein [Candidatus Moduliflexus flocculans]|nr:glycoside hydrolase family 95 protein [Candidatus Moduliflexus flocculans]
MGYPVEQQKYQSLGQPGPDASRGAGAVAGYRHELDLDTAVATTRLRAGTASRFTGARSSARPSTR